MIFKKKRQSYKGVTVFEYSGGQWQADFHLSSTESVRIEIESNSKEFPENSVDCCVSILRRGNALKSECITKIQEYIANQEAPIVPGGSLDIQLESVFVNKSDDYLVFWGVKPSSSDDYEFEAVVKVDEEGVEVIGFGH